VRRYIANYPTVAAAQAEAKEALGDQVELTLATMALGERNASGSYIREPNITALIFLAKTIYKDRGYVERVQQEHTGADGGPMRVEVVYTTKTPGLAAMTGADDDDAGEAA